MQSTEARGEVDRLRAARLSFRSDIVTGPGGSQTPLDDPSGNLIELFQPWPSDNADARQRASLLTRAPP